VGVPINYNLRNIVERKGTTLMTALGIGLTVAVLVTSIAMTTGMAAVFAGSGHPLQVLVLRKGTDSELNSSLKEETYQIIRRLPGIATAPDGEPMASPEALTVVNLPSVENPNGMNVSVRGFLPIGRKMRETAKLKQGRWNEPGVREVVVGEGIASRYPDARVGKTLKFGRGQWQVVGEFSDGDSAANSEIWADLNQLRGDFERQGGSSSILVRMASQNEIEPFKRAAEDNQQLRVATMEEREYYKSLTKSSSGVMLQFIGFFVSIVMAVGAGFAATNTMYAAVARRAREIATLRALGFGRFAILRSFVFESICLALLGGIVGILIALPLNNMSAGIGNWQTFSEMAFKFRIDHRAILWGLVFAGVIGALGGFLPAWSASRKNIVTTMRDM
jgi:ABC-type lipoprotein release transport system permease subunit